MDESNADLFIAANKKSPVVYGFAIGQGGEGAGYELSNGQRFTLTAAECEKIGPPRWKFSENPNG